MIASFKTGLLTPAGEVCKSRGWSCQSATSVAVLREGPPWADTVISHFSQMLAGQRAMTELKGSCRTSAPQSKTEPPNQLKIQKPTNQVF